MYSFENSLITLGLIFSLSIPYTSFSQNKNTLDIALRHLEEKAKDFNLTPTDIANYRVSNHYTSSHNGVTHIYLQQQYENINVRGAIININILSNGEVLNIGNRFTSDLASRINTSKPAITSEVALQKAYDKFFPLSDYPIQLKERKSDQHFIFENKRTPDEPIIVQLSIEPLEDKRVRLVWQVELYQLEGKHWWEVQVDAENGDILNYRDKIIRCSFDNSNESCTKNHIHTKKHNNTVASTKIPFRTNATTVMGSTYNVFPIPIESPNHGDRELVVDPADLTASPLGWHDTDGVDGPEFTITRGNNVHAYHDLLALNQSLLDEPDGGASLEFDFPFVSNNTNPYTQRDGAIVNLFYWSNVIHDLWYQYGFDEVSGNFQENNYGNGGIGGDYLRAEGLDGSFTNNAFFFPTTDGNRPRMEMFIWGNDPLPPKPQNVLTISEPADVAGDYEMLGAGFGGGLPIIPLEASIVIVDDGVATTSDGCEAPQNAAALNGNIALIDRGSCEFGLKALLAEDAGAVGFIVCQNDPNEGLILMGGGDFGDQVTIPGVMISLEDCNTIKMNLNGLTGSIALATGPIAAPGPVGLDADFDNGIIVHEYAHGISNRLTGGPGQGGCLNSEAQQEQAGEGWSDWFGLVMQTTSANNAEEGRGIGTFAAGQPTTGGGIRPFPYSRDMGVNPHTYSDLPNVAVPHGVGSIWAVMIWDLYWNMVDLYGFDDDLYNGEGGNNKTMQLVLDGLKLQECNPNFLEARDAIIEADEANFGGIHKCLIWETFARRGLGVDATAGGGANFDTPGFCNATIKINKTAATEVNAGEVLTYTIEVRNDSQADAADFVVTDELPDGTELVNGSVSCGTASVDNNNILSINLGDVIAGDVIMCTYDVLVASTPFSELEFEDFAENGGDDWEINAATGPANWDLSTNSFEGNFAWFAENITEESDLTLTTANSYLLTGDSASLVFWHSFSTEATWDGGVVEISTDGGNFWDDLEFDFLQNGYNSTIMDNPASTISGQPAFTGNSNGYIQSIVDLSPYSGEEALIRFRFASDAAVGGEGWYIDNIQIFNEFHAITNVACIMDNGTDKCSEATTIVFDNTTSTNNIEEELDVAVFPNPTDGKVFIRMGNNNNSSTSFKLISMDGRLLKIKEVDFSNGTFDFDLSGLPAGVYTLQIQTDEAQVIRKLIVE